jgi:NitT/TauT family transport system substrate-binding protein
VVLYSEIFMKQRPQVALKFMRAYIRAVRDYNDALRDGKLAGPNADEVVAVLTEYTFIKDPQVHREITPAAIDPDGKLSLSGLSNDLAYFKEQKLLADPSMTVERIVDTSIAAQAVKELGPYVPRVK